jgi:putative ABC transport system substrate-binding protein
VSRSTRPKQLELLKEIIPKLSLVAFFANSNEPGYPQLRKETELAAEALKVQIQFMDARGSKDVETAFRETTKRRADAVLVPPMPIVVSQRVQIADLAAKNRLPAMYGQPEYVDAGGLMFYGASITDLFRLAATYVDKILKGAKPADLPVEQPKKFEFIVNLKAAKQIGLTIPPNVLVRADKVIR